MPLPGDVGSFPDLAAAWITGILDAALRGTLLLLAAGLAARLLRDAPAAARHAVWASALVGLLLTPLLQPLVPAVEAPFVPEIRVPAGTASPPATAAPPPAVATPTAGETADGAGATGAGAGTPPAGPVPPAEDEGVLAAAVDRVSGWGAAGILGGLWLAGFLAVLGTLVLGKLRIWWLARDAERIRDGPWLELRDELAARLEVDRSVMLLRSSRPLVPMTWGLVRPRVLLPAAADGWPPACKRNVLLHELAHVKRRDLLVRHLARLTCALYWFHPLVWMATRRLRLEQEEACDDHVLRGGALASDYARHLVGLARVLKAVRSTARAGSTGGGRTDFARRMRALLAPSRERRALSGRWLGTTVAVTGALILGLAALAPDTPADEPAGPTQIAAAGPGTDFGAGAVGMQLPSIRVERRAADRDDRAASRRDDGGGVPGSPTDPTGPAASDAEAAAGAGAPPEAGRGAGDDVMEPSEGTARDGSRSPGGAEPAPTDDVPTDGAPAERGPGSATPPRTIGVPGRAARPIFEALGPSLVAYREAGPSEAAPGPEEDAGDQAGEDTTSAPIPVPGDGSGPSIVGDVADEARGLLARLDASADSTRRADLLRRAARGGETRTMSVLMEVSFRAVRHADRIEAVRALALEADPETRGRFLYQVARVNPWPGVRAEAIGQLRRLRPERVVPWLVHLAYHDGQRAVQRRAVGALARLGGGGAESSLTQIARSHPDADVRIAAIYWLVRTGSGSALAEFVQAA